MNVGVMKKMLSNLPDDMAVVMDIGEDVFITVCEAQSKVVVLEEIDLTKPMLDDEEEMEALIMKSVLLLMPCTCGEEMEKGEINSQPELN